MHAQPRKIRRTHTAPTAHPQTVTQHKLHIHTRTRKRHSTHTKTHAAYLNFHGIGLQTIQMPAHRRSACHASRQHLATSVYSSSTWLLFCTRHSYMQYNKYELILKSETVKKCVITIQTKMQVKQRQETLWRIQTIKRFGQKNGCLIVEMNVVTIVCKKHNKPERS